MQRIHIRIHTYTQYARTHIYTNTPIHIYTYTHIHIHTYTRTHVHTYTHIRTFTYTHIHINKHTIINVHIHRHRHTHARTYLDEQIEQTLCITSKQLYQTPHINTFQYDGNVMGLNVRLSYSFLFTKRNICCCRKGAKGEVHWASYAHGLAEHRVSMDCPATHPHGCNAVQRIHNHIHALDATLRAAATAAGVIYERPRQAHHWLIQGSF